MLDEREIDIEIARLEYAESSYPSYAKLADLYTIKNQMHRGNIQPYEQSYSAASAPDESHMIGQYGDSEFLHAIEGKDPVDVWPIIDGLMDTLKTVNVKVYNRVMDRIGKA